MREFAGIDLGLEGAPDETTVCKFRHLLERNKLGKVLLTAVNDHLHRSGIKIAKGTIVDATIIGAPSSTKNRDDKRDPEMHQVAKGQQWHEAYPYSSGIGGQRGRSRGNCPICCTARRRGSGATRAITVGHTLFTSMRRTRGILRTDATASMARSTQSIKPRTATNRGYEPRLSTYLE